MTPPAIITSFSGEFRFLSNFYPARVRISYHDEVWPTAEHAYQASKVPYNNLMRDRFISCKSPGEAKRLGRKIAIRCDWEAVKEQVMLEALRAKFANDPLRTKLVETYPAQLIEGNNWGDTYWGVCGGKGKNRLGVLLMQVREELR